MRSSFQVSVARARVARPRLRTGSEGWVFLAMWERVSACARVPGRSAGDEVGWLCGALEVASRLGNEASTMYGIGNRHGQ